MKEENKYYIPEIEEFHVGFEYQQKYFIQQTDSTVVEWRNKIIDRPNQIAIIEQILRDVKMDGSQLRIKYLGKEDIESLGWVCVKEYSTKQVFQSEIKEESDFEYWFELDKYLQTKWIEIAVWKSKNNLSNEKLIFQGIIKNKSEFKTLLRQLNISK